MAPPPDLKRRQRFAVVALVVMSLVLGATVGAALAAGGTHPRAAAVEPTTTPRTVRPPTTVVSPPTTTAPGFQTSPTVPSTTSTTQVVDGFHITTNPSPVPVTILYTIQPGDTLTAIAAKFDQRGWGKLFVTNWVKAVGDGGIVDPNLIYPGRVITVTTINGVTNMTMSPASPAARSPTTTAG